MGHKPDLWVILSEEERGFVWDKVYSEFNFRPSMKNDVPPFEFKIPADCYDISNSPIYNDDSGINERIKSAFAECMGDDGFMYALDWRHTCFRYNPRIDAAIEYPVFIEDLSYGNGGYNIWFPTFYPDGDYYFFIAKDFIWGYLTHPWLKKVWVFGGGLVDFFRSFSRKIGFTLSPPSSPHSK
jgi:hypothetical protein